MKKILLPGALLLGCLYVHAQTVNIPDPVFKEALINTYLVDTNGDGEIQVSEAESYEYGFSFAGESATEPIALADLTGIEAFINLSDITIRYSQVQNLDLSSNDKLWLIDVGHNNLASLNIANCAELTSLYCNNNTLTGLDVSDSPLLKDILCTFNQIAALDISQNPLLETLLCGDNEIASLDVSGNLALTTLDCARNNLPTIDISANQALTNLNCEDNELNELDVTANANLEYLACGANNLTNIDLSGNLALEGLYCYDNQLTEFDVSGAPNLLTLYCGSNPLTSINLSQNVALVSLSIYQTPITWIDLSANPNLVAVSIQTNYNLEYINLKNGNNQNISTEFSQFGWLPALTDVCLDDVDSALAALILFDVLHPVNFSETCIEMVGLDEVGVAEVVLSPNPVNDVLSISGADVSQTHVYNMLGQEVANGGSLVSMKNIEAGVYAVHITDTQGRVTHKTVVKK